MIKVAEGRTTLFGFITSNKISNIKSLTESKKDALIRQDANNLFPIIIYELATGTGRKMWIFDEQSNVTRAYYSDWIPNEIVNGFIREINARQLTYEAYYSRYKSDNNDPTKRISISLPFSPFSGISLRKSGRRHSIAYTNNNWVKLLFAGGVAFVYPASDGWADVSIHVDVSRTSLMLHLLRSYDRDSFNIIYRKIPPMSTVEIRLKVKIPVLKNYFSRK